jgi:hypothetical protein
VFLWSNEGCETLFVCQNCAIYGIILERD